VIDERLGLVVGEFFPPHFGHAHLIGTARAHVREVHLVVLDRPHEHTIPGDVRAEWLRKAFPEAVVHVIIDDLAADDWAARSRELIGVLPHRPDVLFSSEDAGALLAGALGCENVDVLRARRAVPIDAAAIRRDPVSTWRFLLPAAAAGMCRRVAFVGAESTGKTTLSKRLADVYNTDWVYEYGRDYTVDKIGAGTNDQWDTRDFVLIAQRQVQIENKAALTAGPILFCDTDAFATAIWHERYLGFRAPEVEAIADGHHYDLYVLCGADVPFEADGVRFSEDVREWMTDRFAEGLSARPEPWIKVEGSIEQRVANIRAEIERLGLLTPASIFDAKRFD
jgi:HTH-type transcriptional repressor of NAD biosynthesis genes